MSNIQRGFTLAEVLVTLAIIGVIASLTIPKIVASTNKTKYGTALKKTVAVLNQVIIKNIAEDDTDTATTTITDNDTLAAYFAVKLNVLKNDGNGSLWLADGTRLSFFHTGGGSGCGTISDVYVFDPNIANACYVVVDVNGDKKPNIKSYGVYANATAVSYSDVWILGINPRSVKPVILDANTTTVAALKDINGNVLNYTEFEDRDDASMCAVLDVPAIIKIVIPHP